MQPQPEFQDEHQRKLLSSEPLIEHQEVVQAHEQAHEGQLRSQVGKMHHPLLQDPSPFGSWLRSQVSRQDRVGAVARVAAQDPSWPGGGSRQKVISYFLDMGAREFVRASINQAWDEFDRLEKRARSKAQNRHRNKQRKATRRSQRK